jgi:hypothetical protein
MLTPGPDVRWIVEECGVRVFAAEGQSRLLEDLEAAAWDLTMRGGPPGRAAALLAVIGDLSLEAAAIQLQDWVTSWRVAGWTAAETGDG